MLAVPAAVMVFIALGELVHVTGSLGQEYVSIAGVVFLMPVMAASVWVLQWAYVPTVRGRPWHGDRRLAARWLRD
jgi:hypothetical protein